MTPSAGRPVSAVVIALNEEKNITACLESLRFADEIVVALMARARGVDHAEAFRSGGIERIAFRSVSVKGSGLSKS